MNFKNTIKIILLFLVLFLMLFLVVYLTYRIPMIEDFTIRKDGQLAEFNYGNRETSKIPNIIWTFWEGEKNEIVDKCIESWKYYNPSYTVNVLNKSNYLNYIDINIESIKHSNDFIARFSDYIRICILAKYGGFWIDSSIICHHPFTWVHGIQNELNVEMIGYYIGNFTVDEYKECCPVIENWFIACIKDSTFINDWKSEFLSTNDFNSINDYLEDINRQNISTQNISSTNYLTMHVSVQKILQQNKDKYSICVFSACDGPFIALCESDWNVSTAIQLLTNTDTYKEYYKYAIIKLRGHDRSELEKSEYQNNAFSHLQ